MKIACYFLSQDSRKILFPLLLLHPEGHLHGWLVTGACEASGAISPSQGKDYDSPFNCCPCFIDRGSCHICRLLPLRFYDTREQLLVVIGPCVSLWFSALFAGVKVKIFLCVCCR